MQNIKKKSQSLKKKAITIAENGIEPISEGMQNFYFQNEEVEQTAKIRMTDCFGCPFFVDEPIESLRVNDERIPELSNKMCNECGCTLSYKVRQSKTICAKWLK